MKRKIKKFNQINSEAQISTRNFPSTLSRNMIQPLIVRINNSTMNGTARIEFLTSLEDVASGKTDLHLF